VVEASNSTFDLSLAGTIGDKFENMLSVDGMSGWLTSAIDKVMSPNFEPAQLNTDNDLNFAKIVISGAKIPNATISTGVDGQGMPAAIPRGRAHRMFIL
jgi:hypothetical protein